MKNLEKYIEEATKNITEDRAATKTLLMTVMKYIQSSEERHRDAGLIAAKYLETLQRSNEQLVKLCTLMSKGDSGEELTDKDFEGIFEAIQNAEKDDDN